MRRSLAPIQSNDGTGLYAFTAAATNNGAGAGGDAAATFLLGYPFQVSRAHLVVDTTLQTWEPSFFVQDDWRASDWLTVNLGLRYDIFTPFTEEDGEISNLDVNTLQFLIPGQNGTGDTAGVKTDYGNLAPRIGFAATLRPGTVVRGGYGLSFFPSSMASNAVLRNTPVHLHVRGDQRSWVRRRAERVLQHAAADADARARPTVAGTIAAVETDLKSSYLHQFNVMVEQQLWGGSVTAGYVGSQGSRLWMSVPNLNYAPAGAGAINARRPYAGVAPNLTTLQLLRSAGQQDYNALQLAFTRRSRGGLTLAGNYTLAKGMSDVTQPGGGGAQQAYGVDPNRIHELEWSPSDIDIRHRYAFSLNYQLPFGQEATGAVRYLVADWQVNLLAYWQSGVPFTVYNATARSNTGAAVDRPNQICSGVLDNPTVDQWFDTACFVGQDAEHHRQLGPQQPLRAAAAADGLLGVQGHRDGQPAAAAPPGGLQHHQHGRASRCPTAPWERPPLGGSPRRATTSRGSSSSRRSTCSERHAPGFMSAEELRPVMQGQPETFDAIVVGSGISGGWAAKELTERGLRVLLLERGKNVEHGKDYTAARKAPWEYPHRGGRTRELVDAYPVLKRDYPLNEKKPDWWANEQESPYTEVKRFDWYRGYQVGGRSLTWGRQSYRHSDLDFEANAKEGIAVDWPIRYADIAPWYDHAERHAGISGSVEGLPQLPDGQFQPAMPLNVVETALAGRLAKQFEGTRRIIPSRVANLTQPLGKRGRCQYPQRLPPRLSLRRLLQHAVVDAAGGGGHRPAHAEGPRHRHRRRLRQGPQAGHRRARARRRRRSRPRSTRPRSCSSARPR